MSDTVTTDRGTAMLAVIEEIVADGLIRDWPLLAQAQQALREGGPDALARLYQDYVERPGSRAMSIRATLRAHGKRALESQYARLVAIWKS
jgi:hypothetical protein